MNLYRDPSLYQQRINRHTFSVLGHIKRTAFGDVVRIGRYAKRLVNGRVDIFQSDRIFDRQHRMPVAGFAIYESFFESATKEDEGVAAAEVAVEAVHLFSFNGELLARMLFGKSVRLLAGGG